MPRLPRIYIENAIYFVTCRAEHNEHIFKDKQDYDMFLELLNKYQEQYGIKIFAYCLMPDHLHLLLEMEKPAKDITPQTNRSAEMSDFMRGLNNNYTKYFNSRYVRKGHLFRERFKSAMVEKDSYLLKMTAYLHLNPETLNLTSNAREYPYSSYQLYLNDDRMGQSGPGFMKAAMEEALGLLKNQGYADFVSGLSVDEREFIHKRINRGGVLGSEDFVSRVRSEVQAYQAQVPAQKYEVNGRKNYRLFFVTAGAILIVTAASGGIYLLSVKKDLSETNKQIKKLETMTKEADRSESQKRENRISEELRSAQWEVRLVPVSGGKEDSDTLSFRNGKFLSLKLISLGFNDSNYSQTIESDGKLTWETMQSVSGGIASWRGEMENGKLRGTLSLRQDGKEPQDFSFVSTGYSKQ